jgi:ketosteroid isomerase-like protein
MPDAERKRNISLVEKMYDCFNRGDLQTIKEEVFASDLVWRLPGRHPLGGTKNGPDEVLAFFAKLGESGIKVDLIGIDAWGDDTVVEVHRGHGTAGNATLDALNCTHYHVRGGRIADVQVYMSDQYAADNFFWEVYGLAPIPERLGN